MPVDYKTSPAIIMRAANPEFGAKIDIFVARFWLVAICLDEGTVSL